jgi:hypothetical protein
MSLQFGRLIHFMQIFRCRAQSRDYPEIKDQIDQDDQQRKDPCKIHQLIMTPKQRERPLLRTPTDIAGNDQ